MSVVSVPWLFRLPNTWLVSLLSEWLDMPSIGKLDTAISDRNHRPQFLLSLQCMRSTSVDTFSDRVAGKLGWKFGEWMISWWRWLSVRQIYIQMLTLHGNDARSDLVVSSLQKVIATTWFKDEDLFYLVRNCPTLRSLSIELMHEPRHRKSVDLTGLKSLPNLRESLEEFSFSISIENSSFLEYFSVRIAAALIDVFYQCSRLQKVSLMGDSLRSVNTESLLPYGHLFHELWFKNNHNTVPHLLNSCSNLRKVFFDRARYDEENDRLLLTALGQSCPLLEELVMSRLSLRLSDADVVSRFSLHCNQLRVLSLRSCDLSASSLRILAGLEVLEELILDCCVGLTDACMAAVSTMKLAVLRISVVSLHNELSGDCLRSFVESTISQTLETFSFNIRCRAARVDDVQLATALASCHKLKNLYLNWSWHEGCVFGRNGLEGLQAMATGCPLLADIELYLTTSGVYCLATHCTSLQICKVLSARDTEAMPHPEDSPSVEDVQALYPGVSWLLLYPVVY